MRARRRAAGAAEVVEPVPVAPPRRLPARRGSAYASSSRVRRGRSGAATPRPPRSASPTRAVPTRAPATGGASAFHVRRGARDQTGPVPGLRRDPAWLHGLRLCGLDHGLRSSWTRVAVQQGVREGRSGLARGESGRSFASWLGLPTRHCSFPCILRGKPRSAREHRRARLDDLGGAHRTAAAPSPRPDARAGRRRPRGPLARLCGHVRRGRGGGRPRGLRARLVPGAHGARRRAGLDRPLHRVPASTRTTRCASRCRASTRSARSSTRVLAGSLVLLLVAQILRHAEGWLVFSAIEAVVFLGAAHVLVPIGGASCAAGSCRASCAAGAR